MLGWQTKRRKEREGEQKEKIKGGKERECEAKETASEKPIHHLISKELAPTKSPPTCLWVLSEKKGAKRLVLPNVVVVDHQHAEGFQHVLPAGSGE